MKKGELIFVYGTLRKGERADLSKSSHQFDVSFVDKDAINGSMYHIGAFPGVKTTSGEFDQDKPTVYGEVYLIQNVSICALLDAYEGYNSDNPKEGLYDRIQTETFKGRTVWVYVYNPPVIADQRIDTGDWCKSRDIPMRTRGFE